jgi:hypothetical protein
MTLDKEADVFRDLYAESIQYGFRALGGEVSQVLMDYLSRKYSISIERTSHQPELLDEALVAALGAGSVLIESRVIRYMNQRLAAPFSESQIRIRSGQDFVRLVFESRLRVRSEAATASNAHDYTPRRR